MIAMYKRKKLIIVWCAILLVDSNDMRKVFNTLYNYGCNTLLLRGVNTLSRGTLHDFAITILLSLCVN